MAIGEHRQSGRPEDGGPTYPDLSGKVALVTGGSGGLGRATCRALAHSGVRLAINGRHEAPVGSVVHELLAAGAGAVPAVATAPTPPRSTGCGRASSSGSARSTCS